jgi:hypothetical protein
MGVIMVSFAMSFTVAFGHVSQSYMDFAESLFTLFKSTMGQFTIREINEVNSSGRILGPFLFVSFIVVNLFVILSMLFAMVNMSFKKVRDDLLSEENPTKPEDEPVVVDITRLLNGTLRLVGYIPGEPSERASEGGREGGKRASGREREGGREASEGSEGSERARAQLQ